MRLPVRKPTRLPQYDYSTDGSYFVTFCTHNKEKLLGEVVGGGVYDAPQVELSPFGVVVQKYLLQVTGEVSVDKFVVMPNHVHLLLTVDGCGSSQAPNPTNGAVPKFISLLKRRCNRVWGRNIWQRSFYDHVVRNEKEYLRIWAYIDTNPAKWQDDRYYS